MSPAQRLRALAKRTALDGIAEELVAIAAELDQHPAAQEVDDGDVTGQPGPLPETGWDEVPEGAFRKPSPTAGMNLGERIKHVGGRENAAGYIEFGSVAAVRALVRQYLRDLPAPQQATHEPVQGRCRFVGEKLWGACGVGHVADVLANPGAYPGYEVQYLYTRPAPGVPAEVRAALEFYASGNHFVRADADAWETVSGEPPNFWEDEANTATVEDGTIARNALAALAATQAKQ